MSLIIYYFQIEKVGYNFLSVQLLIALDFLSQLAPCLPDKIVCVYITLGHGK